MTITSMITPVIASPSGATNEMIASTVSRITSGLRAAKYSRCSQLCRCSRATSFGPNCARRSAAFSEVSPSADVSINSRTSAGSNRAASASRGEICTAAAFLTVGSVGAC